MAEQGESTVKVGTRVLVKDKGMMGFVRYVGETMFAPGKWIGIELDEPKGKNNGKVLGKTYFVCRESHGLFVRQGQIQVTRLIVTNKKTIPIALLYCVKGRQ